MADTMDAGSNGFAANKTPGALSTIPDGPKSRNPEKPQAVSHYHSYFSSLLSWEDPRASGIAYATVVSLILAARYLDVVRWGFKLTWMALGTTVAAEVAGKTLLNNGIASQLRPKKYYQLSRETVDTLIGDVHELANFFFLEAQKILYAENIYATTAAFVVAFISYFLVKVVPYWALAILGTTVAFAVPPVYAMNKEVIDEQLKNASDVVNEQTTQLRSAAGKHTSHVTDLTKQYMGDYSAKAQSILRGRSASPEATQKQQQFPAAPTHEPEPAVKESDFPAAPAGDVNGQAEAGAKDEADGAPVGETPVAPAAPPATAEEEPPLI